MISHAQWKMNALMSIQNQKAKQIHLNQQCHITVMQQMTEVTAGIAVAISYYVC